MKRLFLALALLVVFSCGVAAWAAVTTGTMRVIVRDSEGGPLRGAQVTAQTVESLTKRTVITDAKGEAVLLGLDPSAKYVVTTLFSGYNAARNDNVLLRSGETTALRVDLTPGLRETVQVVARTPLIDVTSAVAGQDLTLELIEALPSSERTYQGYLQFVSGVGAASMPGFGDDPASRSGLNMGAWGGSGGNSTDNFYYIEGINVTDIWDGNSSANFNTEAIQEQSVITGGIPAEYKGAPGLISNVVTKSGGNDFTGSLNYFLQHDGLMATDRRRDNTSNDFRNYDTAITFGGPIMRDNVWFFLSYRKDNRKDFVLNADPGGFSRTVEEDEDQYYAKLSWQMTNNDRLSGTLLTDPRTDSGSANADIVNDRLHFVERGSPRYIVNYQRVFNSGVLEFGVTEHANEVHGNPVLLEPYNDVLFDFGQSSTLADQQLGGGGDVFNWRDSNNVINGSAEWLVNSSWGQHTIKGGFEYEDHESNNDIWLVGDAWYASLNTGLEGFLGTPPTADYVAGGNLGWSPFDVTWGPHFGGLIATIEGLPNRDSFYSLLDLDGDGTITMAEAGSAIKFDSTASNPDGTVNYFRLHQSDHWDPNIGSEGMSFYLQDTLQRGRWTFNAGVRAEQWEHFNSAGASMIKFDWELAPRISTIVDLRGDGKQKLSGFYGRYYDPVRNNMTGFAGTLLEPLQQNQVFVNGEWVTFQEFGGPNNSLALFAPSTKTPYTDEWQLGYEIDLGRNMSLTTNIIKRKTRDLMEDYDLSVYASWDPDDPAGSTYYPGPIDHPDSLYLGLDYFGLEQFPDSIFTIAPLAGGYRDYEGFEIIFRRRLMNRWQGIASYNYGDAQGNTNSDSSASLQSDFIQLDPRAPNSTGTIPGTVEHQVKLLGSYNWDNGIKLGATYRWYSGMVENRLLQGSVPVLTGFFPGSTMPAYDYAGFTYEWIEPGSVGGSKSPSWDVMDIRAQYNRKFGSVATEFFVDVLSVFNSQKTWRRMSLIEGQPWNSLEFGDPWRFAPPRRFYLGARASF